MFMVFINELIEILDSYGIKVKFFADNAKLYVKIVNSVDTAMLQLSCIECSLFVGRQVATYCCC